MGGGALLLIIAVVVESVLVLEFCRCFFLICPDHLAGSSIAVVRDIVWHCSSRQYTIEAVSYTHLTLPTKRIV